MTLMAKDDADSIFPTYCNNPQAMRRLKARWRMIVGPVMQELSGARVLDIAAHDGRWAYAFAHADAVSVTAVEPRAALATKFATYPHGRTMDKITFVRADALSFLESAVSQGDTFDVVAILGFLYHTMEHYRLFELVRQLQPRLIIIDSEFVDVKNGIIQITAERTDNVLNAVARFEEQQQTLVGTPSVGAMEKMAAVIGYDVIWQDTNSLIENELLCINDYFRKGRKRRMICHLVPAKK